MTLKNSPGGTYSTSNDANRVLRIFLWIFGGIVGISILCCVCTLVFFWFTGDFFVEFIRSIFP